MSLRDLVMHTAEQLVNTCSSWHETALGYHEQSQVTDSELEEAKNGVGWAAGMPLGVMGKLRNPFLGTTPYLKEVPTAYSLDGLQTLKQAQFVTTTIGGQTRLLRSPFSQTRVTDYLYA